MSSVRKSRSGKGVARRQKVSRAVEESQRRLRSRVNIGTLPDDVLLEVFDFYLVEVHIDAWHTLVHVCKKWRSIVFASPRRLRLQLLCTNKRRLRNRLDLWPALPIVIRGHYATSRPQVADSIIAALKLHNRVCDISINDISDTLLKRIQAMKMKNPFPVLTHLDLRHHSINIIPFPDSFLGGSAPELQRLALYRIPFPALPKLLLSTHHLATLIHLNIPPSGYFSPEAMVTGLSVLTKLQTLCLEFGCPRSRVARDKRLLPRLTRIVLPALTLFYFKGDSEYLEDIVGQIDMPLLDRFDLMFFNQLIFDTPLLCDFISRKEAFKAPHRVYLRFSPYAVQIHFRREGNIHHDTLSLLISCRPFDWQLSSASQVFNSALSHLTFEHLEINSNREHQKDDTENAEWLEVLRPFASVKDLVFLSWGSVSLVAPALEELAGGRVIEVLPALQNLFVQSEQPSEPVKKAIGKFISARRLSGHPVTVLHREYDYQAYQLLEVGDQ